MTIRNAQLSHQAHVHAHAWSNHEQQSRMHMHTLVLASFRRKTVAAAEAQCLISDTASVPMRTACVCMAGCTAAVDEKVWLLHTTRKHLCLGIGTVLRLESQAVATVRALSLMSSTPCLQA